MAEFRTEYLGYDDLEAQLRAYAQAHPELVRIESIGRSHEGRDISMAVVTNFETGTDTDKVGFQTMAEMPSDPGDVEMPSDPVPCRTMTALPSEANSCPSASLADTNGSDFRLPMARREPSTALLLRARRCGATLAANTCAVAVTESWRAAIFWLVCRYM